jgi:hypothetical protein
MHSVQVIIRQVVIGLLSGWSKLLKTATRWLAAGLSSKCDGSEKMQNHDNVLATIH